MAEEKKAVYKVEGGNIKFNKIWYKPRDTIELTANEKKQVMGSNTHIKLTPAKVS